MRSTPKFSIGDVVYVTGYDEPGRDCKDGLIVLGQGAVTSVLTRDVGRGDTAICYGVENATW